MVIETMLCDINYRRHCVNFQHVVFLKQLQSGLLLVTGRELCVCLELIFALLTLQVYYVRPIFRHMYIVHLLIRM